MLETHLDSPVTRRRLRTGRAADHIDAFADWLHTHGYKPVTIDLLLRSLAGWTDWLLAGGFTSQDLLPGFEACQLASREEQRVRYRRGPNQNSITAAAVFIRFLQHQGTLPLPVTPPSAGELWPLLGEFRARMRQHRGLTETTLDVYDGVLIGLREVISEDPRAYTAEALRRFVSDRARPHGIRRAKSIVVAVRSFVRFLGVTGNALRAWNMPSPASPPGNSHRFPGF